MPSAVPTTALAAEILPPFCKYLSVSTIAISFTLFLSSSISSTISLALNP